MRPAPSPSVRRAFTLVEMLVAAALGTIVISGAILLYNLANRSRGVTASARSLQTALLIEEHIRSDVSRVAGGVRGLRFDPAAPTRMAFWVSDLSENVGPTSVAVRAVQYKLETSGTLLKREYDARVDSMGVSPVTSAAFLPFMSSTGPMIRVSLVVGRSKDDPAGPSLDHSFLVRVPAARVPPSLTFVPRSNFMRPEELPPGGRLPYPGSANDQ